MFWNTFQRILHLSVKRHSCGLLSGSVTEIIFYCLWLCCYYEASFLSEAYSRDFKRNALVLLRPSVSFVLHALTMECLGVDFLMFILLGTIVFFNIVYWGIIYIRFTLLKHMALWILMKWGFSCQCSHDIEYFHHSHFLLGLSPWAPDNHSLLIIVAIFHFRVWYKWS